MSINAKYELSKLQELLEQKKAALGSIHKLTLEQQEDIEKNQGESLESFIDDKQKQIEKIEALDESFNQAFSLLKFELGIESLDQINIENYPQLREVKKTISEIMELTETIMVLEEKNKAKDAEIIDGVERELKTIKLGQKSLKAYDKPNINIGGVYIDRKK
ncbi:MAG: flagellar export chaperone FlgN [Lutispora sp.]|nr:flagellar export chaperone FlgN [Lutispora sp.]